MHMLQRILRSLTHMTGKSSETSTEDPRQPWVWAAESADLGSCKSVEAAGETR